jgi:hypothetical protein
MTTLIMMDADHTPAGIKRRLREEFARHSIDSETDAAQRYGRPQQWVSRRMTGETEWKVGELDDFCRVLGLSFVYVATGIRPILPNPPGDYGPPDIIADNVVRLPPRARRSRESDEAVADEALRYIALADGSLPCEESNLEPFGQRYYAAYDRAKGHTSAELIKAA